mgnify:CR=1 FL=1
MKLCRHLKRVIKALQQKGIVIDVKHYSTIDFRLRNVSVGIYNTPKPSVRVQCERCNLMVDFGEPTSDNPDLKADVPSASGHRKSLKEK